MTKRITTIYFLFLILLYGQDWYGRWDQSGSTWLEKWNNTLDSVEDYPQNERIEILGAAARAKSTSGGWRPTNDQLTIANRSVGLLLAIPGHAEYYRDRILRARGDAKSVLSDINVFSIKFSAFSNEKSRGFETLGQLPSAETVRVLGEFLSDEWVSPIPIQGDIMDSPLSHSAVIALANLPLVSKPADTKYGYQAPADHDAWLSWYEQIKAGNRTFRFKGDPVEYDLNGPAPKEKLQRVERDSKRDAERAVGQKKSSTTPESETAMIQINKPFSIAWLVAAIGLGGTVVWYFMKSRRSA